MRVVIGAVAALGLAAVSACQSALPFDQLEPNQREVLLRQYRSDCTAFGFRAGTTDFANCVQQQVIERDRGLALQRAASRASSGPCGRGYGYGCGSGVFVGF